MLAVTDCQWWWAGQVGYFFGAGYDGDGIN